MDDARTILASLQSAIDARQLEKLLELFGDSAVLIGTAGDGRTRDALVAYLTAVAEGEPFRWKFDDIVPFHEAEGELGFAAFGEIVAEELRAPVRVTIFAVRTDDGWLIREFHGSIPADFS